ncbi:MAG: cupredoxin domain-containing protein [Chloroflexi bacterium]|nr:cupredoxin domain-containing protein [Chloroflexota bacterium]
MLCTLTHRQLFSTVLVGSLLLVWFIPLPVVTSQNVHTVVIDMHQFEFTPGRIEVQYGDLINIRLTSSDVVHGFYLDGYDIEQRVEPGISRNVSFVADQLGKFRFRCGVNCGPLHPFMIGELVVQTNLPFWRALAMLGISLSASLYYVYWGAKHT